MRYLRGALAAAGPADPPPELLVDLSLAEASAGEATSISRFEQALHIFANLGSAPTRSCSDKPCIGSAIRGRRDGVSPRRRSVRGWRRQRRLSFEAAAYGAEYHLPPEQHGQLSAADGTGPGDRAVLAVHALQAPDRLYESS